MKGTGPNLPINIDAWLDKVEGCVKRDISPNDGMFSGNEGHYFGVGRNALELVVKCALLAKRDRFDRILDLPSGHGRVLRYLDAAFPEAEITACEIDVDGVQYCADALGAVPIMSKEIPEEIELTGSFDLIWCGSLFTHIDIERWWDFLKVFARHLSANGLLIFTTAGRFVASLAREGITHQWRGVEDSQKALEDFEQKGYVFRRTVSRTVDRAMESGETNSTKDFSYGQTYVLPWRVLQGVAKITSLSTLTCFERGWDNRQDVYACTVR